MRYEQTNIASLQGKAMIDEPIELNAYPRGIEAIGAQVVIGFFCENSGDSRFKVIRFRAEPAPTSSPSSLSSLLHAARQTGQSVTVRGMYTSGPDAKPGEIALQYVAFLGYEENCILPTQRTNVERK